MKNLHWFVYVYDGLKDEIDVYDIFKHNGFKSDILTLNKDSNDFDISVKHWLKYWFSSRSQWEITICDLFHTTFKKINICDQVLLNFDRFIDYLKRTL